MEMLTEEQVRSALADIKRVFGEGLASVQVEYSQHGFAPEESVLVEFRFYHAKAGWSEPSHEKFEEALSHFNGDSGRQRMLDEAIAIRKRANELEAAAALMPVGSLPHIAPITTKLASTENCGEKGIRKE